MATKDAVIAIFRAVEGGDVDRTARLLDEEPCLLEARTLWYNHTPLIKAAQEGHIDVMRFLLERGADINTNDLYGSTALHMAAGGGHEDIACLLLSRDAEISRRGELGRMPLLIASKKGHMNLVRLLLRRVEACGLDERDNNGKTALSWACEEGHAAVVRTLLLAGADHAIADYSGHTPRQIAEEAGHPQCAAVVKWWEGEQERAYVLYRARALHEDTTTRQQAPGAPVPAYLQGRVASNHPMPQVDVLDIQREAQQDEATGEASGGGSVPLMDEEGMNAMVRYVIEDLGGQLYTELADGLRCH